MKTQADSGIALCTGEVRHHRLRPAVNRFSYGVFFIRVPLRSTTTSNSIFFSRNRLNLMSFHDRDHGDGAQPLTQWIDTLLKQEGVHDADGEIWLQCFPRVLGYVFNPVSFWFCHRADGSLRAIVCEVRNTFGEKHLYLLDTGETIGNGQMLSAQKIFHVSPFCAVQGRYRFRFMSADGLVDPDAQRHIARIEYEDDAGPLLLTSISGTERALTTANVARVLLRYPLMTLTVMARIHIQALYLFIKRVPFFSKPQPPSTELSR
jgi:uncharacterized protein